MRRRKIFALFGLAVVAACTAKPAPKVVDLEVRGMVCESCVEGITHTVSHLEGVVACEVDLEKERARVTFAPDVIDVATIEAAIDKLGYDATPLSAAE